MSPWHLEQLFWLPQGLGVTSEALLTPAIVTGRGSYRHNLCPRPTHLIEFSPFRCIRRYCTGSGSSRKCARLIFGNVDRRQAARTDLNPVFTDFGPGDECLMRDATARKSRTSDIRFFFSECGAAITFITLCSFSDLEGSTSEYLAILRRSHAEPSIASDSVIFMLRKVYVHTQR